MMSQFPSQGATEQVWAPVIQWSTIPLQNNMREVGVQDLCHLQSHAECVGPHRTTMRIVQNVMGTKELSDWLNWWNISWHPPPLSSWTVHCFCFKGNITNHVCQVKFTPEKLPVHRKTTEMVWRCRKNLFSFALMRDEAPSQCSKVDGITNIGGYWKLLSRFLSLFVSRMQWQHHTLDCT